MRVCFDMTPLMSSSRFRGIGMYCVELARAMARAGDLLHDIELYLLVGRDGLSIRLEPCKEALVSALAADQVGGLLPHDLYYVLKHTLAWTRLSLSDMDLYHSAEPRGTSRPLGCRIMVTCHDFIRVVVRHDWDPPRRLKVAAEWLRFRGIAHAIAISCCTRDDLMRFVGLSDKQVTVVYHGIDSAVFNPDRQGGERARVAAALGSDRPYLLYVGAFDQRKQVPGLVRSFCRYMEGMDEVLVLCGQMNRRERWAIERELRTPAARRRVLLPGYLPADLLPALYRGATAHVLASCYEGFGMTVSEALACGCPVIALRASSIPEVAGEAALLVDPGDLDRMGEEMVRLASDAGLREELRARGLVRARRFTWERCAEETLAVYRKVLGRTRSTVDPRPE